jgi:hypothetical protein
MPVTDADPIVEPAVRRHVEGESFAPPGGPPVPVLEPGDLVASWRIAIVSTWALVVFVYSAVWKTSVEIGIGTWWLGARSDPQPVVVRLIPFAVAICFGMVSSFGRKRIPVITVLGAFVLALIALPDFARSLGLAALEIVIAGAVLLVGIGAFTGVVKTADR